MGDVRETIRIIELIPSGLVTALRLEGMDMTIWSDSDSMRIAAWHRVADTAHLS